MRSADFCIGFARCIFATVCMQAGLSTAQDIQPAAAFSALYSVPAASFLGRSVVQTTDGGYIAVGVQTTTAYDVEVLKLSASGSVVWQNTYRVDGQFSDGYQARQTTNGSVVVAVVGPQAGPNVLLVLNLDSTGNLLWQATYPTGGTIGALPLSIEQTADGGYLLGATNYDNPGDIVAPLWGLKLDALGNIVWQKVFGFIAGSIHATADGGSILAGTSLCTPTCEPWIVKLDDAGNVAWQNKYFLGAALGFAGSARQTSDGGYLVAGSYNPAANRSAAFLMKLDANGGVVWRRGYASATCSAGIGAYDAEPSAGGFYLMLNSPCTGAMIARLDAKGVIRWQDSPNYALGSPVLLIDEFSPTRDGGYIATGSVGSLRLAPRFMALKADAQGGVKNCSRISMPTRSLTLVVPPAVTISPAAIETADTAVLRGNVGVSAVASHLTQSDGCRL
jgi:hypothetical protein